MKSDFWLAHGTVAIVAFLTGVFLGGFGTVLTMRTIFCAFGGGC